MLADHLSEVHRVNLSVRSGVCQTHTASSALFAYLATTSITRLAYEAHWANREINN